MHSSGDIKPAFPTEPKPLSGGATTMLGNLSLGPEVADPSREADPYTEPIYQFIAYDGRDGNMLPVSEAVAEAAQTELLRRRKDVLALPSQEEGLDMERVDRYRQEIGAPKKPIRVLTPDDFATAKRIAEIPDTDDSAHNDGHFLALLDVIIVKRGPQEGQAYAAEITEGEIIHELAHGSGRSPLVQLELKKSDHKRGLGIRKTTTTDVAGMNPSRVGFATVRGSQKRGFLLEELYPEFERGHYVTDVLGLPDGFVEDKQTGPAAILNKYAFPEMHEDGSVGAKVTAGAMGAATLELLVTHDPELREIIRSHRQTPEELDAIVGSRINHVIPGLYDEVLAVDLDSPRAQQQAVNLFARAYQQLQS